MVIGNASLAIPDKQGWRSLPRLAYASQSSITRLYRSYCRNQIYVYPGHKDYGPGHNGLRDGKPGGFGDVFHANTPYLVASQGSSGSDQGFLRAFALTLAALPHETKRVLMLPRFGGVGV